MDGKMLEDIFPKQYNAARPHSTQSKKKNLVDNQSNGNSFLLPPVTVGAKRRKGTDNS
jgi:hypothetical protein